MSDATTDTDRLPEYTEFERGMIETGLVLVANSSLNMSQTEWNDFSNGVLSVLDRIDALEAENATLRARLKELDEKAERAKTAFLVSGNCAAQLLIDVEQESDEESLRQTVKELAGNIDRVARAALKGEASHD